MNKPTCEITYQPDLTNADQSIKVIAGSGFWEVTGWLSSSHVAVWSVYSSVYSLKFSSVY